MRPCSMKPKSMTKPGERLLARPDRQRQRGQGLVSHKTYESVWHSSTGKNIRPFSKIIRGSREIRLSHRRSPAAIQEIEGTIFSGWNSGRVWSGFGHLWEPREIAEAVRRTFRSVSLTQSSYWCVNKWKTQEWGTILWPIFRSRGVGPRGSRLLT